MATTKSGGIKTGFSGFGSNVVASNKAAQAKQASTPAFSGAVSSAFKSGATALTNKGSGGQQAAAAAVAESKKSGGGGGGSSKTPTTSTITPPPYVDVSAPIQADIVSQPENQTAIPFAPLDTSSITGQANALVESITAPTQLQTTYDQQVADREAALLKEQKALTKITDKFDLTDQYAKLQRQQGIPDLTKQLQQANLQLAQMQSQYQITNQELAQQTIPQAFVIGQQNELAKTAAIQIGAQAAYVQALQGNLDLANHYVDQMIDLEYKDYQNRYENQKYNIELAKEYLGKAEARQAKAIDYQLDLQKIEYSNMLDIKKSTLQNALENGADSATIGAISRANTVEEISSAGGKYLVQQPSGVGTGGVIVTDTGKPMNDTQATSYGYAQRLVEANNVIQQIGSQFTGVKSYVGQYLPNILKTDTRQQFEQAQRNFANAVLRRESGAVISEAEFDNARKQYIPQPGDSESVLAQKAQNRQTVISNFYRQAGVSGQIQQETVTRPEDLRIKYNY